MASRHRSRELAVQMTYQWELDPKGLGFSHSTTRFWTEQAQSADDNKPYFEHLVKGVADYLPQIDGAIESVLENWRLGRMEKVDLAVLRVSVYELLYGQTKEPIDTAVIINEAVELAKKFGTKESPSFINGILDSLAKKHGKDPRI